MKTLRAYKGRQYYKSEEEWLNAVYKRNQIVIDSALENAKGGIEYPDLKSNQERFKTKYYERKQILGEGGQKAMDELAKSSFITSKGERIIDNFTKSLRTGLGSKSMRDEKGRFAKSGFGKFKDATGYTGNARDLENVRYIGNNQYIYRGKDGTDWVISFTNSPETVNYHKLMDDVVSPNNRINGLNGNKFYKKKY